MKYKLKTTTRFERDFRKLKLPLKRRIDSAIKRLENEPHLGKTLRGELKNKRSLRVAEYRVIYTINEANKTILLLTVGHRKAVYK